MDVFLPNTLLAGKDLIEKFLFGSGAPWHQNLSKNWGMHRPKPEGYKLVQSQWI